MHLYDANNPNDPDNDPEAGNRMLAGMIIFAVVVASIFCVFNTIFGWVR